jgi:hypothetical protein
MKEKDPESQALVAHACNPNYSEDRGLWFEASLSKQFVRLYLEKPFAKNRAGRVAEDENPEFKPQYCKKKKKKTKIQGICIKWGAEGSSWSVWGAVRATSQARVHSGDWARHGDPPQWQTEHLELLPSS